MSTRREIINRITTPLVPLYGAREARSIALLAASELGGVTIAQLLTDPEAPLDVADLESVVAQLTAGRPVQYVLGSAEFCSISFLVREGVLIPRPETEELVAWVSRNEPHARTLLDVGTGSGCIAIALKRALPSTTVFAADISEQALAVAAENAHRLGVEISLRKADALHNLQEVFPERFEVIVSNPPYVPQSDLAAMHTNVRNHEPHTALFVPDNDPLLFYRAIALAGREMLTPNGRLYFEIYEHAADAMRQMLSELGYAEITLRNDINDKPRMICCHLN